MAVTKALYLKGAAGIVAAGAAVGSGLLIKSKYDALQRENEAVERITAREWIDNAGLDCGLSDEDSEITGSRECSIKVNGTIGIKRDGQTEEGIGFASSDTSKLKVSRSRGGYRKNLKFVVDSGDISLTKGKGTPERIQKLEQFETYEIRKVGDRYYLLKKTGATRERLRTLGLGKCTLPVDGSIDTRCRISSEDIGRVGFDGVSIASEEVGLRISKMGEEDKEFRDGYRFTFTFPGNLTIRSRYLRSNTPYDFRIKDGEGNVLTLERAWSDDDSFIKKAGLVCGENNECNVASGEGDQKLNVKVGALKRKGIESLGDDGGKIKIEREQEGYNQGLKFTIEGGDVSLTGGEEEGNIEKLEELETYEITEDGGEYFLTRKSVQSSHIESSLVLPKGCELPKGESVDCNLTAENFKAINFEGKSEESFDGESMVLTISRGANTTDFPFGYRFSFRAEKDATVTSNKNIIKANIPTEFKIKKRTEDGRTVLSLERAWTYKVLGEKAGLICPLTYDNNECSIDSGKLNVIVDEKRGEGKEASPSPTEWGGEGKGRIMVEKDVEGYNEGFKFTVDTSSFTLSNGSGESINTLEEYETYEVKEEGDKFFLNRKTNRDYGIKSSLSIPQECELPTETTVAKNCKLSAEQFKAVNFEGKGEEASASATVDLKISKVGFDDFPMGYRFTFHSLDEATIKKDTNTIKGNTHTDFRIRRTVGDQKTTLSLEKAWDNTGFTSMVGLDCTDSEGTICSVKSGTTGSLNVKKGTQKKEGVEDISSDPAKGKIKVDKEINGYNQGLKFSIIEENVDLEGGSGDESLKTLDEYEIYEITEEAGKYFLTRKLGAESRIISSLSLHHECELPTSTTETKSCNLDEENFKKVNFDGKSDPSGSATLTITKTEDKSTYPFGYKFSFQTNKEAKISGTNKISANTPTDFKIKKTRKNGSDSTLSLEKKS